MISFEVPGLPIPQGSKVGQVVGKRVMGGRAVLNPKVVLTERSDMKTPRRRSGALKRWRQKIAEAASLAWGEQPLFEAPVMVACEFVFARPPSHYTKLGKVTKSARLRTPRGDLSHYIRAVEDALTGVVWKDDVQVAAYRPVIKRWAERGGVGGAKVWVYDLHDAMAGGEAFFDHQSPDQLVLPVS